MTPDHVTSGGMSEGAGDRQWTLSRIFRIPGAQTNTRGKVWDSIVVIGVTQAMLLGLLSTDSDSSSSGDIPVSIMM